MNCKQGDLAIIVKSRAGNEGKIVRCLKLTGIKPYFGVDGSLRDVWEWEIDSFVVNAGGKLVNYAPDDQLRLIRDPGDDAQDETLQWLDVPSKIEA